MQTCDQCGTRAPQLPVRIEVVRESGPIGLASAPRPGETANFTKGYAFCGADHLYAWARERRYMLCNRAPTPFEEGMQPYLPSRHMGGRVGLCDGHHTGPHEWTEAWPG
jgi:hypothetical protein